MKYKQYTIEELEDLIGKSCDLVDLYTGEICKYEVFIIGVRLVSGFLKERPIEMPTKRDGQIRWLEQWDGMPVHKAWHQAQFITNVRDARTMKGRIHPYELNLVDQYKNLPTAPSHWLDAADLYPNSLNPVRPIMKGPADAKMKYPDPLLPYFSMMTGPVAHNPWKQNVKKCTEILASGGHFFEEHLT